MPPPHVTNDLFHRALANEVRRQILISLGKREKYLSEIASELDMKPQTVDFHLSMLVELGLISADLRAGKRFYKLEDPKILEFLRDKKPIPPRFHPKPPHEIMNEMWEDIRKRLDRIEKKLDSIS
ncbi:winged helix-turn-helix transcriptional regulator [Candidatus Woesearchaeota archaeon]|jgi:DNA-binding transcriptional ArsR family regulator|nr:winged helix-turn-helix transcriptional regulator [Candidatus Woesearchaeota archaeon]MBT4248097.1 winged helix-turn-helix transcriptional regulator [Candidatus Woesearchaeota archaeon]